MVTGVETAGLVLASVPLIVAGLELYVKGIGTCRRFRRYKQELESLLLELRTEETMFVNTINILLVGVVRVQDMPAFLADPCGKRWNDPKFEKKLKDRLGMSYLTYIGTIGQMNVTADNFKERLKLDPSGNAQFSDPNAFKQHYKRLKFSICRSDYVDLMAKLRQSNLSLCRMTTQTLSLESLHASTAATARKCRRSVPNFNMVHNRAKGFYFALREGWNCPCSADHSVNLRLEPRMDESDSDSDDDDVDMSASNSDRFHVVFCYSQQSSKSTPPWTWEEADIQLVEEKSVPQQCIPCGDPPSKGVRFEKEAKEAVKAALNSPEPNMRPIQDLCAAIGTLKSPQRDVCLSLLAIEYAKQKYGMLIYPLKEPSPDRESWSVSSLGSVLKSPTFTRENRLRLAVTLASSVLQLYETPWLEDDWGKDSIFFISCPGGTTRYEHPFVAQRLDPASCANQLKKPGLEKSFSRIIRNQTLFALGTTLIELWYGKSIQELHKPEDGLKGSDDFMTAWNTADRLVDELYVDAGAKYGDAVRRCIRCDFDRRDTSLGDGMFQRAVYDGVVAQLKENLDFLYR